MLLLCINLIEFIEYIMTLLEETKYASSAEITVIYRCAIPELSHYFAKKILKTTITLLFKCPYF